MKKYFFFMSLLVGLFVSVVAFTGCSSDNEDSPSNPLIGTWYVEGVDHEGESRITEVTYNADNSCTWREYGSDKTTIIDADTGTYKVDGNKLSIWWDSEREYWEKDGPWTTTFTINENKMTTTEAGGTVWTKR